MHWLAEEVEKLRRLAETGPPASPMARGAAAGGAPSDGKWRSEVSGAFLLALRRFVGQAADRPGVSACFASHDGLVIEAAGDGLDFEAMSALSQVSAAAGRETAGALSLGGMIQMVIVGVERKLALVVVGPVAIGIVAPTEVNLARVLAD